MTAENKKKFRRWIASESGAGAGAGARKAGKVKAEEPIVPQMW